MSIEENRNCGCGNNNEYVATSVMNTNMDTERRIDCEARDAMLKEIQCLDFAIVDISLYLDTHPEDEKALCLHRKYCKEAKELKDKYQKVYGPLTINFPCNKWRWIEEPWPWERGN